MADHLFGAAARDGWMPIMAPDDEAARKLETLRGHLKAFGRDPAQFGIES